MQVDIVSDIVEGRIDIDLRNIEGNRSCIKKVRLYKDGSQSGPIFTKDVTADFRITLPGDNESLFCENTQMKILLSDHQDNQIGERKTLSLMKLSNDIKKIVLKPVNNDILKSCLCLRQVHFVFVSTFLNNMFGCIRNVFKAMKILI